MENSYKINYSKVIQELSKGESKIDHFSLCKDIYNNIGGTLNPNPVTEEKVYEYIEILNSLKIELLQDNPGFLHIIYGGACRIEDDYEDCIIRRYFWPYIGYYADLFVKASKKEEIVFPKMNIIIFDPKITDFNILPRYINNLEAISNISLFKIKLNEAVKLHYIREVFIPKNQDCIINNILIEILSNCMTSGGICSFLNEVKGIPPMGDTSNNNLRPFVKIEKLSFNNPNKFIFLNWNPTIKFSDRSINSVRVDIGEESLSVEKFQIKNVCLLSTSTPEYVKNKDFISFFNIYNTIYNFWSVNGFRIDTKMPFSYINMNPLINYYPIFSMQMSPNITFNEEFNWKLDEINQNNNLLLILNDIYE